MTLGEKIKELRTARGMTQEQLADAVYVTRAAVSKWETGKGYPAIDSLKLIAELFGVSIDELISGDDVRLKREKAAKSGKVLYAAAVIFLLGAFIFAALVYALGEPLYCIGATACVLCYIGFAFFAKNEYARIAGRAAFDLKRKIARAFVVVLVALIIIFCGLDIAGII